MKLKKIIRKIVMSAAAALLAAAMTVTSFAANPENLPTGSGGTLPGTINVTPGTVTPGQIYTPTTEKEDRSGTKYQPGKYTNNIPEEERTTIHFVLANKEMATGEMKDVIAAKNCSFQLPQPEFKAKDGYTFARYVGFDGREFQPDEYISLGDADEYWVWACFRPGNDMTTVHFKKENSSMATGKMDDVKIKSGSTLKLPECTFVPIIGYDFKYWKTPNGNVKPGYSIKVGNVDEITVYAVYDRVKYVTVTFDNGLQGSKHESYKSDILFEYDNKNHGIIILPKPIFKKVEGAKFKSWKVGNPGEKYTLANSEKGPIIYAEMDKTKVKMSECTVKVDYSGDWNVVTKDRYIIPKYTVTNKYGIVLEEGVDFKAEYNYNYYVNNKAQMVLTGINGNKGTKKAYYKIKPPKQNITKLECEKYGSNKGKIFVGFDKLNEEISTKVEIQVSNTDKFYAEEYHKYTADLKEGKLNYKYIDIKEPWDNIYVRVRYIDIVNGDWSDVKSLKLK